MAELESSRARLAIIENRESRQDFVGMTRFSIERNEAIGLSRQTLFNSKDIRQRLYVFFFALTLFTEVHLPNYIFKYAFRFTN
jgi:hypothetical protein